MAFSFCYLFLAVLLISHEADAASTGPLLGLLKNNILSLKLGSPLQTHLLTLDLDASVSRIKCRKYGSANVKETLSINSTDGSNPTGIVSIPDLKWACGDKEVAALSKGPLSLVSQLASKRNISKRFTYCLSGSSSPTPLFFGVDKINFLPGRAISPFLQYTPLLLGRKGYYIGVNGISVGGGNSLQLKPSQFRISSTEPYTRLEHRSYVAVRQVYRNLTIQRVPPVAPFDTCFNASKFGSTRVGPPVPSVELNLKGNKTWTLFGANTIAFVKNETVGCLAFVDAGKGESVIGRFQQLDNLIDFDSSASRFGFTGILYFYQTTCSNFNFTLSSKKEIM